jgi:hypothetical protein
LASGTGQAASPAPKTKEDFLAAVKGAYEAQDKKRVHALTWEAGMSDFERNQEQQTLDMMVYNKGVQKVYFQELPPDFMDTPVAWGRRIEPTHKPDGIITVDEMPSNGQESTSIAMPYACIDGTFYLITAKSTDLQWKGPRDHTLNVSVTGTGADKVKIHVKYNASGVDLERDQSSPSNAFPGQYVSEVRVTSASDEADVKLRLLDETGKAYYESARLKGRGEVVYRKGE